MSLDDLQKKLTDLWGGGALLLPGDKMPDVERIPTGILSLDLATKGGLPAAKIIQIVGQEGAGKTSLAAAIIAHGQRHDDRMSLYIDAEDRSGPSDLSHVAALDTERLAWSNAEAGLLEADLDVIERAAASGSFQYVVLDSLMGNPPRVEAQGTAGDAHMAQRARLLSARLPVVQNAARHGGTTIIIVNQLRANLGITYGNPNVPAGGNALKFHSSVILSMRVKDRRKDSRKNVIGQHSLITLEKNLFAPRWATANFHFDFVRGRVDIERDLIEVAVSVGVVVRAGAWYKMDDTAIGSAAGLASACAALRADHGMADEIRRRVWESRDDT